MKSFIEAIISGKSADIFRDLMKRLSWRRPHHFIDEAYALYQRIYPSNASINGLIFEYLICETLARSGVVPFYYQAQFERVPNADFDVLLYDGVRPVVLTMKVSLRERYKQADLEGLALRQVYRRAESYLITMSSGECNGVAQKIESGAVTGLNRCILATTPEYENLINDLKGRAFVLSEPIQPITRGKVVIL